MINAQVDDLSSYNTKYTSPALTQKAVEDAAKDEDDVNEVSAELTPPSPTPVTPPLSPTQEHIPSPPHAQTAQPSSPPPQEPSQTTDISSSVMTLLNTLMETYVTVTKQVANLEHDKIAQAIEITKLKQRVRRLKKKRQFKSSRLKRLRKVGTAQRVESSADTVMDDQEDASKQQGGIVELDADEDVTLVDAEEDVNADVQGRLAESQAKVYHLDLEHAEKVLSMQDTDEAEPAEVEEVIEVVTAAKLMTEVVTTAAQVPKAIAQRRRRGVVIQDPKETATALVIVHSEVKSTDKGKGILIEEPKPLKRQAQIEQDEAFADNWKLSLMLILTGMIYGLAKVKSWKLFESCRVHIITFTTTHMILLAEKKYPLTHFTLEQMLNNVRLEVKEESEMSLELLSFGVDAVQDFKKICTGITAAD
nr:hypothetical protein [Tanacetum cinerariifolium]